jgi:hypothetical protein
MSVNGELRFNTRVQKSDLIEVAFVLREKKQAPKRLL